MIRSVFKKNCSEWHVKIEEDNPAALRQLSSGMTGKDVLKLAAVLQV